MKCKSSEAVAPEKVIDIGSSELKNGIGSNQGGFTQESLCGNVEQSGDDNEENLSSQSTDEETDPEEPLDLSQKQVHGKPPAWARVCSCAYSNSNTVADFLVFVLVPDSLGHCKRCTALVPTSPRGHVPQGWEVFRFPSLKGWW